MFALQTTYAQWPDGFYSYKGNDFTLSFTLAESGMKMTDVAVEDGEAYFTGTGAYIRIDQTEFYSIGTDGHCDYEFYLEEGAKVMSSINLFQKNCQDNFKDKEYTLTVKDKPTGGNQTENPVKDIPNQTSGQVASDSEAFKLVLTSNIWVLETYNSEWSYAISFNEDKTLNIVLASVAGENDMTGSWNLVPDGVKLCIDGTCAICHLRYDVTGLNRSPFNNPENTFTFPILVSDHMMNSQPDAEPSNLWYDYHFIVAEE